MLRTGEDAQSLRHFESGVKWAASWMLFEGELSRNVKTEKQQTVLDAQYKEKQQAWEWCTRHPSGSEAHRLSCVHNIHDSRLWPFWLQGRRVGPHAQFLSRHPSPRPGNGGFVQRRNHGGVAGNVCAEPHALDSASDIASAQEESSLFVFIVFFNPFKKSPAYFTHQV